MLNDSGLWREEVVLEQTSVDSYSMSESEIQSVVLQ